MENNPSYKDFVPTIIAIIALATSIISLYWTRVQYEKSSRPFVWASNYGVIDNERKTIIPIAWRIACRVKNSPTKIIEMTVIVKIGSNELIKHKVENFIRFPDETSEWSFDIGENDFDKLMNRSNEEKFKLTRIVSIEYSSIDGGKIYQFKLEQSFNPDDNQWKDTYEDAN